MHILKRWCILTYPKNYYDQEFILFQKEFLKKQLNIAELKNSFLIQFLSNL